VCFFIFSQNNATITLKVDNVNEVPTSMKIISKLGGAGVNFEDDQPIIMENVAKGSTVAWLVVMDPDAQEEITVLVSELVVVSVGTMSCLPVSKVFRDLHV
jgi:hypothetical protein